MAWRIVKKGFKAKRMKRQPRIRWERLGLDMQMPEKLPTPIEEIRREVLKLASRGMKPSMRSQPAVLRAEKPIRRRRRGATE
ncbi:MAG: hypothetical protein A3H49_07895 [Nitrospirae bacterium RIFCSPLOWO2_02_FULL_62_14]|nr:MAG: hypothetical protein A3H49_07895 [Nitrospirae bacterium RIFCSPLOWO2_02_FULL_62_14]OGW70374.1 MAG: hypothetical protein A3A88_02835 [Nitrospirae bacterium RIFCSPLOWO2_01_FULL_62_17]